jgi:hypothetical protein
LPSDLPGLFYLSQNEIILMLFGNFLCYNLFMGYRTYEADKYGRITIYPFLNSPARKSPGIFKITIKKLSDLIRGIAKNSTGMPKV